jgi:hypothetical protein
MIHCAALGLAPSCARITGSVTLTTEPSMNVMLEARIVATSTARRAASEHGCASRVGYATAVSQGCMVMLMIGRT